MFKQSLYLCAMGALLSAPVLAETSDTADLKLETVDVSGLRPISADDTTVSLSVVDSAKLAIRNTPFLADQLRTIPGVGVSRSGSKGGLTQIRIRGAEANHTLVLLNGIEVSDPTTGETNMGLFSGLNIDRIEVLRGEQSGIYGSDAIGGVVNFITSDTTAPKARIEYGSLNTKFAEGSIGANIGSGQVLASVSGFSTDGVDTSGNGLEEDGTDQWSALLTGAFDLSAGWKISGLAGYSNSDIQYDSDTDYDGRLNDVDLSSETEQMLFGAALTGTAFGLDHQFRASFTTIDRDSFSAGALTDTSEGERTKLSYSPSRTFDTSFAETFRLTGILDYEKEDYSVRDIQYGGLTNQDQTFETLGLAGELFIDWGKWVSFASLRFDDNDGRFDDAVSGRIGAAYDTDAFGRFRASVGTGTKNPNFTELFGFYPGSFIGNPDLKPETSTGWELGWDYALTNMSFGVTYFESELEDEIYTAYTPAFLSTPQNRAGKSERSGVEFTLDWTLTDEISVSGQASFIDSNADDGSVEIRIPHETASVAMSYRPSSAPDYVFGLALDYTGDQDDFDFGSYPSRRVTMDSYLLASATAELPVTERLAITLRGENLFDEQVSDVYGYESPGATVYIGLKLR